MAHRRNRREFLQTAALGTVGGLILPNSQSARAYAANEKLNLALVGVGKRGSGFVSAISRIGENLVALCDVNPSRCAEALKKWPQAEMFQDFRKMLDTRNRQIDGVIVATPDHTHAVIAAAAMKRGKHVYVEKPIAHDVAEARALRKIAQQYKVATQMGNQGMATDSFRRTQELIQQGAIGDVREVHVWYVFGGSGPHERPRQASPVPRNLDWDLWLGPAPFHPYHPSYVDGWGAWRDFGTGCLGGGGSHSLNLAFKALKLADLWENSQAGTRIRVETTCSEPCPENFPRWQIVQYHIPSRGSLPPVQIHWYNAPEEQLVRRGIWERLEKISGRSLEWKDGSWTPRSGTLLVGSKGVVHTNAHNSVCTFLPEKDFADVGGPPRSLPRSGSHDREWIRACRGGPKPYSNFDHAALVIELLLLGNVASLVNRTIEFDPANMTIDNDREADRALRPQHRKGWEV